MTSVPCCVCELNFPDILSFRIHFQISHQNVNKLVCKIPECNRSFNLFSSFRKHLISTHNVPASINGAKKVPSSAQVDVEVHADDRVASVECSSDVMANDCDSRPILICDVKDLFLQQEDYFVAKLYSNPAFPRNLVDSMVKEFSSFLTSPFFEKLKDVVTSSLDPNLARECKDEIIQMFEFVMNPFDHLKTEFKRFKYFQGLGEFIPPEPYDIFSREERAKSTGGNALQMKSVTGQFIPLRKVFTKFFYLPHALEDTLSYMSQLSSEQNWFANIIQGSVWKRKLEKYNPSDIVIPINVYYDELEPNSALGAHCEPLGCTYVQIATLPPEWSSRLENIFLALLFDADNRSIYGNRKAFRPLLEELLFLETQGIEIETNERGKVKFFLVLAVIIGDNKALNGICGFVEGFTANYFCRICKCFREEAHYMCYEDVSLLRTPENYAADVLENNSKATGIKEECIFNDLPSFCAPIDIAVDEFHDLIEGMAHYIMVPVLRHFNNINPMFLTTLNGRLYSYSYGIDNDNRPPLINKDKLYSKDKLKMTGAEMYLFIRVFGVLVVDMVPENDEFYKLYLLLNDIISIVHAKGLPKETAKILYEKVKELNRLYMDLTKETLKPKFHMLLHYARLLAMFGPFGPLSTIRHEAKHHLLRLTASTCMSRVNLSRTVATKQQLGFCFRVVCNASIRQPIVTGPSHILDLKDLPTFPSFSLTLPDSVFSEPTQCVYNWVEYKGTKYQPRQVLLTNADEIGLFVFSEIHVILVVDCKPLFICSNFDTVGFYSDVRGYEVKRTQNNVSWLAIEQEKLLDPHPLCLYQMASGETVVILRYVL